MRWWSPTSVRDCSSLRTLPLVIINFILSPCSTCLRRFLGYFIPPPAIAPIISGSHIRTSQSHPLPYSFPGTERHPTEVSHTHHPPASATRSRPCAAYLCLMPYPASVRPPFATPVLHPVPCRPLGFRPSRAPHPRAEWTPEEPSHIRLQ